MAPTCPSCGSALRSPADKFCASCGQPVAPAAQRPGAVPAGGSRLAPVAVLTVLGGVVAAIVVAVVLLSGGDNEEGGPAVSGQATEEAGGEATEEAGATATAEEEATPTGEPEEELVALVEGLSETTFRAEYELSGDQGSGTLVIYHDVPNLRLDFRGPIEGEEQSLSFILRPPAAYLCFEAEGQGQCLDVGASLGETAGSFLPGEPGDGGLAEEEIDFGAIVSGNFDLGDFIARQSDQFEATEVEGREIAGIDGRCFRITPTAAAELLTGEAEFCFSEEGVLLLASATTEDGTFELRAVEVSGDVSDGDFEPPYPISEGGLFG